MIGTKGLIEATEHPWHIHNLNLEARVKAAIRRMDFAYLIPDVGTSIKLISTFVEANCQHQFLQKNAPSILESRNVSTFNVIPSGIGHKISHSTKFL